MSVGIACVSAFCDAVCVLRHGVMLLNLLCPLYKSARSRHCRRRDVLYSTHEGRGFISLNNVVHMKVITYSSHNTTKPGIPARKNTVKSPEMPKAGQFCNSAVGDKNW